MFVLRTGTVRPALPTVLPPHRAVLPGCWLMPGLTAEGMQRLSHAQHHPVGVIVLGDKEGLLQKFPVNSPNVMTPIRSHVNS